MAHFAPFILNKIGCCCGRYRKVHFYLLNVSFYGYIPGQKFSVGRTFVSSIYSSIGCVDSGRVVSLSDSIHQASDGSLVTIDATMIQKILKSYEDSDNLQLLILKKVGKLGTAVKLFSAMWKKGFQHDVTICNCIIDALCFKKRIPEALEIFGEMNERGCLRDVATYNSLIKHLCKIRRMEKVRELLDEMEQKGCLPNSRTYSYILKTMKKPEEVVELLQRMKRGSRKIDSDTYNLILNLYVRWNYQRGVQTVWTEMETCGLGPDQRSYTIRVHGLHSQGKLDEALYYFFKSLH